MAKNELAVIENFELALDSSIMDVMAEELGEDAVIPYDRIKIPSGGGIAFEIPSDDPDNPDSEKEIEGIIVYAQSVNAYWENAYDGANTPPSCSSADGKTGLNIETGEVHNCKHCPFNEFGSGDDKKGKACKNMKRLYILRTGAPLPVVLTLPPTSIKPYTDYVGRQIVTKGLRTHHVITKITLKKEKSGTGIAYSKAQFAKVGKVPEAMKANLTELYNSLKESVISIGVDSEDYDRPANETAADSEEFTEIPDSEAEPVFENAEDLNA